MGGSASTGDGRPHAPPGPVTGTARHARPARHRPRPLHRPAPGRLHRRRGDRALARRRADLRRRALQRDERPGRGLAAATAQLALPGDAALLRPGWRRARALVDEGPRQGDRRGHVGRGPAGTTPPAGSGAARRHRWSRGAAHGRRCRCRRPRADRLGAAVPAGVPRGLRRGRRGRTPAGRRRRTVGLAGTGGALRDDAGVGRRARHRPDDTVALGELRHRLRGLPPGGTAVGRGGARPVAGPGPRGGRRGRPRRRGRRPLPPRDGRGAR